jgi:hypothetical protein
MSILRPKHAIYYAPMEQRESPASFASNGIRASKLPLVALIIPRN